MTADITADDVSLSSPVDRDNVVRAQRCVALCPRTTKKSCEETPRECSSPSEAPRNGVRAVLPHPNPIASVIQSDSDGQFENDRSRGGKGRHSIRFRSPRSCAAVHANAREQRKAGRATRQTLDFIQTCAARPHPPTIKRRLCVAVRQDCMPGLVPRDGQLSTSHTRIWRTRTVVSKGTTQGGAQR